LNKKGRPRWHWDKLQQHVWPPDGIDFNNFSKKQHVNSRWWTSAGSPGVQTIDVDETEHIISRDFRMQDSGPPNRHGTYNLITPSVEDPPFNVPQNLRAPKRVQKTWTTP
jgi:hypothetical protein